MKVIVLPREYIAFRSLQRKKLVTSLFSSAVTKIIQREKFSKDKNTKTDSRENLSWFIQFL